MLKTYMYRIYPSKKQKLIIDQTLETCRRLHNTFLYERKGAYKNDGKSITYYQQAISLPQRKKGAVAELARAHEKVAGQRRDIAHKTARKLIGKYDMIAHEKLQIKNMVKNRHLSKSITDAGWGIFFGILSYKAESAGRKVIEVDPYNTSQICSECGSIVSKKLSERWHKCPVCGYSAHRDVNAARNILNAAIA